MHSRVASRVLLVVLAIYGLLRLSLILGRYLMLRSLVCDSYLLLLVVLRLALDRHLLVLLVLRLSSVLLILRLRSVCYVARFSI